MKCCAVFVSILLLLIAAEGTFASSVKDIGISLDDGAVVVRIEVEGPIRFTHQTEIPKDGKPHRVIVDVLSAVHELPGRDFTQLPRCLISNIRTSQYSVKPEQIVRLVLDMESAPFYQIDTQGKFIVVTFPDKSARPFLKWSAVASSVEAVPEVTSQSSGKVVESGTVRADKNKGLKVDRPANPVKAKSPALAKATTTEPIVSVPVKNSEAKPERSTAILIADATPAATEKAISSPRSMIRADGPMARGFSGPKNEVAAITAAKPDKSLSAADLKVQTASKMETAKVPESRDQKIVDTESSRQLALAKDKPVEVKTKTAINEYESSTVAVLPTPAKSGSFDKPVPAKSETAESQSVQSPSTTTAAKEPDNPRGQQQALARKLQSGAKPSQETATASSIDAEVRPESKTVTIAESQMIPVAPPPTTKKVAIKEVSSGPKQQPAAEATGSVPQVAAADQIKPRPTSRFRRSPDQIKGTMVAEFPKRLVVKYKQRLSRDPFATLVNESSHLSGPMGTQVPNIEGLRLVGIIESRDVGNRALLEDAHGYSYILKSGDKVKKGYVLRVEGDQIYFQVFEYGWSRTVALALEE